MNLKDLKKIKVPKGWVFKYFQVEDGITKFVYEDNLGKEHIYINQEIEQDIPSEKIFTRWVDPTIEEKEEELDEIEIYSKVFDYFGYENQRRKLVEEIHELNDEIFLYERGQGNIEDVITETADVLNILKGFMVEYDITADELREKMESKMDRTIKRIDSGYYGSRKSN